MATDAGCDELVRLRDRFKRLCASDNPPPENYRIRIHRALSWYENALAMNITQHPEGRILYDWIALNALYGSWDGNEGRPARDQEAWKAFLSRLLDWDAAGAVGRRAALLRPAILTLVGNRYLDRRFWQATDKPYNASAAMLRANKLFAAKDWYKLLTMALDRIYVLRGQIVHGAATSRSKLNRDSVSMASQLLEGLLPVMLAVAIEHGAHHDWPQICYPPVDHPGPGQPL